MFRHTGRCLAARLLAPAALVAFILLGSAPVAEAQECQVVELDMTPSSELQMVVWLEDAAGNYVDTLYISLLTGSYGLGNRPGMMTFNSAWRWPYGRRTSTFPVWAHRHGMEWPLVVFQNGDDTNLSHPLGQSSGEEFFCRPLRDGETHWDTQTCASTVYTDKGQLSTTETSLYPPRIDLNYTASIDHEDVMEYADSNPFDDVSRATPIGEEPFRVSWPIPDGFPTGDYVMWVEVSKEFDQNSYYSYPAPIGIPWSDYGLPYRGQPSVVYAVPFAIDGQNALVTVEDYVGYSDPDGLDGNIRVPDETITTGVDGSGASRLLLTVDGEETYRLRLSSRPTDDISMPQAVENLAVADKTSTSITATFTAPWDDNDGEPVAGYEIRYMVSQELTEDNFASATLSTTTVAPEDPGTEQWVIISDLVPQTRYFLGIRTFDECKNNGPLQVIEVITPDFEVGTVPWCFVATAAYGSELEQDVDMLRRFRDRFLRSHATGEILVSGYYTFGPALARLIAPSETARQAARATLAPIVDAVRKYAPGR